uniref:Wsv087 n=1 Tax=Syphacia muris TaxID=451379 RepID=A0A0N5ADP0_9BILA
MTSNLHILKSCSEVETLSSSAEQVVGNYRDEDEVTMRTKTGNGVVGTAVCADAVTYRDLIMNGTYPNGYFFTSSMELRRPASNRRVLQLSSKGTNCLKKLVYLFVTDS